MTRECKQLEDQWCFGNQSMSQKIPDFSRFPRPVSTCVSEKFATLQYHVTSLALTLSILACIKRTVLVTRASKLYNHGLIGIFLAFLIKMFVKHFYEHSSGISFLSFSALKCLALRSESYIPNCKYLPTPYATILTLRRWVLPTSGFWRRFCFWASRRHHHRRGLTICINCFIHDKTTLVFETTFKFETTSNWRN